MAKVEISGWRPGFEKVSHTKALKEYAGLDLAAAKAITDSILSGRVEIVEVPNAVVANQLARRLTELGATADVLSENHS